METGTTRPEGGDQEAPKGGASPLKSELIPNHGVVKQGAEAIAPTSSTSAKVPPLGEQVKQIEELMNRPLTEGQVGYIVSTKWLQKAIALARKGETEDNALGAVDNTGLNMITDPAVTPLLDERGKEFIALRPGLQMKEDFEILPQAAWEKVVAWHGLAKGSPVIIRYCHNTSRNEFMENFIFEVYPPVFTVFKLPSKQPTAADASCPPPVRLLASRTESYRQFLTRAKRAANIPQDTNVRIWRLLGGVAEAPVAQPGVLTPVNSRSTSPVPNSTIPVDLGKNLTISPESFLAFGEGSQRELLDIPSESEKPQAGASNTLDDIGLGQEGVIVLEEQIGGPAGGEWVSTTAAFRAKNDLLIRGTKGADGMLKPGSAVSGRSSPTPSMMTRGRAGKGRSKGVVGFSNLGNTCYMNSALQCIRACEELTEYFLGDHYKRELNPSNPLGNHGDVAKAYASLLRQIYKNNTSSVSPREFRQIIGKYNAQFSGYQQQDSQEFVLFLLDGLQEDLNRITKKPYIEKPDSSDEMVHDHEALARFAEENWQIYKARNDSVITDLFAGMYKSTLECPVCKKVSIIFDPYNNLTLQLPIENTWQKKVTFFPLHSRPIEITVEVDKSGSLEDIRKFISRKAEVPQDNLVLAEIYNQCFYKIFADNELVGDIREGDVVAAYQVDTKPTNWPGPPEKKKKYSYSSYNSSRNDDDSDYEEASPYGERMLVPIAHRGKGPRGQMQLFGHPSFIVLSRGEAKRYDQILRKVLNRVSTMTTLNFLEDEGEDSDTVLMNEEDADSGSSEGKVQTSSVQGEEGMVDICMRDADEYSEAQQTGPRIAYPPMAPIHRDLPPLLRPDRRLPSKLDNIFEIRVYKSNGNGMVPAGVHVPDDKSRSYQSLKQRRSKLRTEFEKMRKQKPKLHGQQKHSLTSKIKHGGTPSESEDELASDLPPPALSSTPPSTATSQNPSLTASAEDSSEDDGIPPIQEPKASLSKGYGELHISRLVAYETDTDPDEPAAPVTRKEQYVPEDTSPKPLIKLGEGLVLEWDEDSYNSFFEREPRDADGLRGVPTWESMVTLPDPELDRKRMRRATRRKEGVTLDECLDEFGKPETLSENDAWYCPKCKEHRRATKTFELWKLPDVLVIHLKRFAVQGRFRDKLDVLVNFPVEGLDMTDRMRGKEQDGRELIYDLFAVDNHYGGLGGGHYTAFAKNFMEEDQWYYFDDSSASKRNREQCVTPAAYLLFYRRRNAGNHLGGPNFDKVWAGVHDSSSTVAGSEPASRAPSPFPGEGRRLGGSFRNGLSSAFPAAAAVHQAGGGGQQEEEGEGEEMEGLGARAGTRARIAVHGVGSDLDEGYGEGPDDVDNPLPSYEASEMMKSEGIHSGPVYGPIVPWGRGGDAQWSFKNLDDASDRTLGGDDADVSSTGAMGGGDPVSGLPSPVFGGTPDEKMVLDEDTSDLIGDHELMPEAMSIARHPSPDVAEIRVDPDYADDGDFRMD